MIPRHTLCFHITLETYLRIDKLTKISQSGSFFLLFVIIHETLFLIKYRLIYIFNFKLKIYIIKKCIIRIALKNWQFFYIKQILWNNKNNYSHEFKNSSKKPLQRGLSSIINFLKFCENVRGVRGLSSVINFHLTFNFLHHLRHSTIITKTEKEKTQVFLDSHSFLYLAGVWHNN